MSRSRLSSEDRRNAILSVALRVFAEHGFHKTKVEWVAQEADVSQALIYRHFPTKAHLYRAVLRRVLEAQDQVSASFGELAQSGEGLVELVARRLAIAIAAGREGPGNGARLIMRSAAGEGSLARLIYRRVKRKWLPSLSASLHAAHAAGEIEGVLLSAEDAMAFLEHIASTMQVIRTAEVPVLDYAGDDREQLRSAIIFCARGLGLRSDLVAQAAALGDGYLAAQSSSQNAA
jgi:AcrR family transcriptional regulator